jgi:hypothetical protein
MAAAAKTSASAAAAEILTVAAAVTTAITSVAAAIGSPVVRAPIAPGTIAWCGTILRRVITRSEILRSGFIRIGLPLLFRMCFFDARRIGLDFFDVGVDVVRGGREAVKVLLGFSENFFVYRLRCRGLVRVGDIFSGKFNDRRAAAIALGECRRGFVSLAVIIIFQVFENVADVQEGITIQADIDEGRLHAREDASDAALIDTADERKFFFALDINFY